MAVTLDEAIAQLNLDTHDLGDLAELKLYVDAANEWVATKVTDPAKLVSAPVRVGTLFLIGHLWESQRGSAATPLSGEEIVTVMGSGYAIPNRVLELIGPYRTKATATGSFPAAVFWPDAIEINTP